MRSGEPGALGDGIVSVALGCASYLVGLKTEAEIANMVEVLIRGYRGRNGIAIQDQQALFPDNDRTAQSKIRIHHAPKNIEALFLDAQSGQSDHSIRRKLITRSGRN
ncbi:MAG: hypothetical protein M3461_01615 [Pseudomonadota bacterium]|nr:hypothetical protein [Pseudomonadota bacterium]